MIELKEGHGAKALGVAVLAPREDWRLPSLLTSVEEAARAALPADGFKLLIGTAEAIGPNTERAGWTVVQLPAEDLARWREIAAKHSGMCAWVAFWGSERLMPKTWLLDALANADQGLEREWLTKLGRDTETSPPAAWTARDPVRAIGCTIVTPGYEALAEEAVRRFKKFTGLPVLVLHAAAGDGFALKLKLPEMLPGGTTVCFFDADWWMLRPAALPALPPGNDALMAVPDPQGLDDGSFCRLDAKASGFDPRCYFNSGLMIFNPNAQALNFATAHKNYAERANITIQDTTDQSWLNAAVHSAGVFMPLPLAWNFYPLAWTWGCVREFPRNVIGLHAAGVQRDAKMEFLQRWAAVLTTPTKPLLDTVP